MEFIPFGIIPSTHLAQLKNPTNHQYGRPTRELHSEKDQVPPLVSSAIPNLRGTSDTIQSEAILLTILFQSPELGSRHLFSSINDTLDIIF